MFRLGLFLIFSLSAFQAAAVSDARLQQCYQEFPNLAQSLLGYTDDEMNSAAKKIERQKVIAADIKRNRKGLTACTRDVLQFFVDMNSPDDLDYAKLRMREIQKALGTSFPLTKGEVGDEPKGIQQ